MANYILRFLILALLLVSLTVAADSWRPPKTEKYYSANRKYMLVVVPVFRPEKYYDWMAANKQERKKFNQRDSTPIPCYATLYKLENVRRLKIWKIDLRNKIAPANVILADDGSSVITFDNWGSIGTGPNVMVVYGKNGELLNSYSLKDISPIPISDYYQTVSSVWWRCAAKYIDINTVELTFCDKNQKSTVKQIMLNN